MPLVFNGPVAKTRLGPIILLVAVRVCTSLFSLRPPPKTRAAITVRHQAAQTLPICLVVRTFQCKRWYKRTEDTSGVWGIHVWISHIPSGWLWVVAV